jgi:hypothetical protein
MYIPEQYWCMNRYLQGLKKFSETCFPASILNGYTELWQMPSLQPLNAAGIVGRMKYHQDLIQDLSVTSISIFDLCTTEQRLGYQKKKEKEIERAGE